MKKCNNNFNVPIELQGEDVYNMFYIFDNEDEAINYIVNKYNINKGSFITELHEYDSFREEYGKKYYLREATIHLCLPLELSELMNGEYILWEAY